MSSKDQNLTAWQALARSHRRLHDHLEAALKAEDLPGLDVLDVLTQLDHANSDLTAKDLETHLLMPQYGISRLLDRMEKDALLTRVTDARDKRVKHLRMTEKGRATHIAMVKTRNAALESFLSPRARPGQLDRLADLLALLDQDTPD